ncbi:hypothetical protein AABB02_40475 [Streptomyces rimosus]
MPRSDVLALALATLAAATLVAYVVHQLPSAGAPITIALAVVVT